MNSLKTLNNKLLLLVILALPLLGMGQEKNILERDLSFKLSGEIMDPMYSVYESIKIPTRVYAGGEYKLNSKNGVGLNLMYANYKTFPWDGLTGGAYGYIGDSMTMLKVGRTIRTGAEVYLKRFRSKKSAFYPIGSYFDFGLGLHNAKFTGYDLDYWESYTQNGTFITEKKEIREEVRNIRTMSFVFRTGKQWVFDNNLFWSYGFSFRAHIPITSLSGDSEGYDINYDIADLSSLYTQEILLTDWFSTHLSFGYIL